jgi:small-conductance mechanosensitive channel
MQKIIDFFNYEIRIGSDVIVTPKSILVIIAVFFLTHLILKIFRRIVFKTLNTDTRMKFKGVFTFLNYFIYLIVILIALDNIGVEINTIFAASAALLVGIGLGFDCFSAMVYYFICMLQNYCQACFFVKMSFFFFEYIFQCLW